MAACRAASAACDPVAGSPLAGLGDASLLSSHQLVPSFDHNETNRLTEAANAAQLKPTNEAGHSRSERANQPTFNPAIQTWTMARLLPPLPRLAKLAWPLAWLAECTVGDCMSRISKGCCRPNRGRETRTNCILTHANCQCMLSHPPGYHLLPPPSSSTLRSAAASKFIALQWPSERDERTTVAYGPQLPLCTLHQRTLNAWAAKCGRGSGQCAARLGWSTNGVNA